MKVEVTMKCGTIICGEFSSKRSMLTFIEVPANDVDKELLSDLLSMEIEGLYSIEPKNDGGLNISLENKYIESIRVK